MKASAVVAAHLLIAAVILMATGSELWRWILGPVLVLIAGWISFPRKRWGRPELLLSRKGKT